MDDFMVVFTRQRSSLHVLPLKKGSGVPIGGASVNAAATHEAERSCGLEGRWVYQQFAPMFGVATKFDS